MRSSVAKLSMGSVLTAALFALVFTALPSGVFVDLQKIAWYWGCPLPIYGFTHSVDGDFRGLRWWWYYYFALDLVVWALFFLCAAVFAGVISRRMKGKIRPVYALSALGCLAGVVYAFIYRAVWYVFIETFYF